MSNGAENRVFDIVNEGGQGVDLFGEEKVDWGSMSKSDAIKHIKDHYRIKEVRDLIASEPALVEMFDFDVEGYKAKKDSYLSMVDPNHPNYEVTGHSKMMESKWKSLHNSERMRDLHVLGFGTEEGDEVEMVRSINPMKSSDLAFDHPGYTGYFNPSDWGAKAKD